MGSGAQRGPKSSSRRRVLRIAAAATSLGLAGTVAALVGRSSDTQIPFHSWQGTALGADANLLLHGLDEREAERLIALALAEIARLERIYSLYRTDSALVRLNENGELRNPPKELVALLERAQAWSALSDGAFDVTVQPLWRLYQRHFTKPDADPRGPSERAIGEARALVDYRALEVSAKRIAFARPGMAVTLNGIAQGEITDRVADLLREEGLAHALIDLGEFRALSSHPAGRPWKVGIGNPHERGAYLAKLPLTDRALATSATTGTEFDLQGRHHHLFDPRSGRPSRGLVSASVIARRACDADAFSTALVTAPEPLAPDSARHMGVERVLTADAAGTVSEWRVAT